MADLSVRVLVRQPRRCALQRMVHTAAWAAVSGMGVFGSPLGQAQTPAAASATDVARASGDSLEEVVVTAQFRQQTAQTTPIALTAISAATLESRSQVAIDQIAAQAPNVTLEPGPAAFGPSLQAFIRGVGQADFNYAFEPGVGMYVDDVYYSTITGSIFDLLDLDHVEVLRGPQGTLAGMNSEGGSIKLYSRKPSANGGGYVEGSYGRFNRTDVRAGADFTLVPEELFARIAGVARHQDGYVERVDYACSHPGALAQPTVVSSSDCVIGTEGGVAYDAVRASLRWVPNDRLEVNLVADNTHDASEASPTTLLYVGQAPPPGKLTGITGTSAVTYPRWSTAPTGGVLLGTATGSPFITYSPYGPYAQDTVSHSPYVDYSAYCDAKPPDGTGAYCTPPVRRVSGYGFSGTVDFTLNQSLSL